MTEELRDESTTTIACRGVRTHNLKNVDLDIKLGRWTAITGVSGSGKSSFAFDTLFSEAQRRFLETLGTYERQFLAGLPQGVFESVDPVPPAIALKQTNRTADPRSVIATTADIVYPLRTLFAALMDESCQSCGYTVTKHQPQEVLDFIRKHHKLAGLSVTIDLASHSAEPSKKAAAPKGKTKTTPQTGRLKNLVEALRIEGYTRARLGHSLVVDLDAWQSLAGENPQTLELVLEVMAADEDPEESLSRITTAWEQISLSDRFGSLTVFAYPQKSDAKPRNPAKQEAEQSFRVKPWCDRCSKETRLVDAGDLDWQSSRGCCKECQGIGNVPVIDRDKVVPNPALSIKQGAIKPWTTETYAWAQSSLIKLCKAKGIPTTVPFQSLSKQQQEWVWEGDDGNDETLSVKTFFAWLESEKYKQSSRILLAKYRRYKTCPSCRGARIGPAGRLAKALDCSYDDIFNGPIQQALKWTRRAGEEVRRRKLTPLLEIERELADKLACLNDLGLGSSSLGRRSRSLSGGEYQRVLLSRVLGNGLTDALYVLDEPSVGLGRTEMPFLVQSLHRLRDQGNTVVVVDHDPELIEAADEWIEFGPGGGSRGGSVVGTGKRGAPVKPLSMQSNLDTLAMPKRQDVPPLSRVLPKDSAIWLEGFSHLNCDNLNLEIPKGLLTVIGGPSGAGKSTVLRAGLEQALAAYLEDGKTECKVSDIDEQRGLWTRIEVPPSLQKAALITVDQRAMHRSITSIPATLLGLMDDLRKRFAATSEARERGFGPSDFSFNGAGACSDCQGRGFVRDDLFFLGEVEKICEACDGRRYRSDVLEVVYKGYTIAQLLSLSMEECLAEGVLGIAKGLADSGPLFALQIAVQLGLGHLPLGIPSSQISGGEAQRLRIAAALARREGSLICLIDEPTRGLSEADIVPLIRAFQDLCKKGHTIVVVEHHAVFQKAASQLVLMGPGAGVEGGRICTRALSKG